jgi:hypothetical protein
MDSMRVNSAASQGGDGESTATVDFRFAPLGSIATATLTACGGTDPIVEAGIMGFRFRDAEDVDRDVNLLVPGYGQLPNHVGHQRMTQVTMLVRSYDAWARGLLSVYHWPSVS